MGIDWKNREILQAKMKISLRRMFIKFGINSIKAAEFANQTVDW
jgi:hypothetical protein